MYYGFQTSERGYLCSTEYISRYPVSATEGVGGVRQGKEILTGLHQENLLILMSLKGESCIYAKTVLSAKVRKLLCNNILISALITFQVKKATSYHLIAVAICRSQLP